MIPGRNKFCFTGGYIEAAVQLPGPNNVIGMWPAIWTMGNLGRAGYGASLEGLVRPFPLNDLSITLTWVSIILLLCSGLIPMRAVMSVQHPIKRLMVFRMLQQSTVTTCMGELCLIYLDKDFLGVLVMERIIRVLSILMELMWGDPLLKLTCSKRR